jgi:DNA repair exonuclease SbcCD ATPase subunit
VITLEKLTWSNCFSYGSDNVIELNDNTLTQLIGTNGAGKSSIPLILEEVLFNKNSKGIKKADISNRIVANGYDISLDFTVNEDSYHIDVTRRANIKVKLLKNGEDISSHTATNTYKTLEEIIGIDFKTFSQIVYQNTNASLQFLTATDTNRKKFLIDLLQLDKYVAYFEVFRELSRQIGVDVSRIQGKIDTIEKWLNDNKLENISLLSKMDLPIYSEEDGKTLRSLQIEFENISEITKKINTNNHYKEQLADIDLPAMRKQLEKYPEKKDTSKILTSLGTWKGEAIHEQKMLSKYEELAQMDTKVCPTCEGDIDEHFVNSSIKEHQSRLDFCTQESAKIRNQLKEIENENAHHHQARTQIEDWEELYRSIDQTLPTEVPNADELKSKIATLQTEYRNYKIELEEAIEKNNEVERHNTRLNIIEEQQTDFENELADLIQSLDDVEDKLASVEILKKAFSTNGLLAYKIENLVKDLEELTNDYLAELSDGRFSLEFVVLNDKLNVNIEDNGNNVDILSLSAGELARVNTATLLAIRKLMSSISKSQLNVLFLDEVNNVLDELGKERLVEILLREENLNTYIVSHGWTHPLLEKIEVIKENEMSRLDG